MMSLVSRRVRLWVMFSAYFFILGLVFCVWWGFAAILSFGRPRKKFCWDLETILLYNVSSSPAKNI